MGKKRVWVLGAGFSRSLGGPLIQHLLAAQEPGATRDLFPEVAAGISNVRTFYAAGVGTHWDHAEHFLDMVERAAEDHECNPHAATARAYDYRLLANLLSDKFRDERTGQWEQFASLVDLAVAARRAVACDCSQFLQRADLRGEAWRPYVQWASILTGDDTVATFNYDCVPDLLAENSSERIFRPRLRVVEPAGEERIPGDAVQEAIARIRRLGLAPVLKLHGSVDWHVERGRFAKASSAGVLLPSRSDVLMGLPGPGKDQHRQKRLKPLWTCALNAITEAEEVIFLGYRFPPTDANAREELLCAVRDSACLPRIVLGPNVVHPDVVRLQGLLQYAMWKRVPLAKPDVIPLYVEDFLSVGTLNGQL